MRQPSPDPSSVPIVDFTSVSRPTTPQQAPFTTTTSDSSSPSPAPSRAMSRKGTPRTPRAPSVKRASSSAAAFPPDNWADLLPASGVTTRSQSRSNAPDMDAEANVSSAAGTSADSSVRTKSPSQLKIQFYPEAEVCARRTIQFRECADTKS